MRKNYYVMLLVLTLLAGLLAGCSGNNANEPVEPANSANGANADTSPSEPAASTTSEQAEPPAVKKDPVTLDFYYFNPTLKVTGEMPIFKKAAEATGVTLTNVAPPDGDEKQAWNLLLASGELPDIIDYAINDLNGIGVQTRSAKYFVLTMLFSGGLIPWYMTIKMTGIIDTFWALILPGAVPIFNVIVLLNFFKSLPEEIDQAAQIDGASRWQALWRIAVPLSAPAVATLTLFCIVTHWNARFDGLILMNRPDNYPLQSYLQTVIINRDLSLMTANDVLKWAEVSDRTSKAAQVFVAVLPVLFVYPFLQKYFAEGIVMGSVKG